MRPAGPDSLEKLLCEVPRIGRDSTTNRAYFFKAADDLRSFRRELDLYDPGPGPTDVEACRAGPLRRPEDDAHGHARFERIDGTILMDAQRSALTASRRTRAGQIEETARTLHEWGLIWGDVKLANVMGGALEDTILVYVVGGGCMMEYIDTGIMNTRENDLQGVAKLTGKMLEAKK